MPARVMLLILATALFIAIWSGDKRGPATKSTAKPEAAPAGDGEPRQPSEMSALEIDTDDSNGNDFTPTPIPEVTVPVAAKRPASSYAQRLSVPADVPLPVDLSPGEFQVVSNRGESLRMSFTAEELADRGIPHTVPRRNHYMIDDGPTRWHFIRIEVDTTTLAAASPRTIERPAAEVCDVESDKPRNSVADTFAVALESANRQWRLMSVNYATMQETVRRVVSEGWQRTFEDASAFSLDTMQRATGSWLTWPSRVSQGKPSTQRQ